MVDQILTGTRDANLALEELRRHIDSAEWRQQGRLPTERQLSEMLGISRHPIRRALEVLEAEGLIWRKQGAGTFIGAKPEPLAPTVSSVVAHSSFEDVMEVRLRIEPQLAQLAAMRAREVDLIRLSELNRRCVAAVDPEACELWDGAFHRHLAQMAQNNLFLSMFDLINQVRHNAAWQKLRDLVRDGERSANATGQQHQQVIDAVAARDPVRAGWAMREHLLDIQFRLLSRTGLEAERQSIFPTQQPEDLAQ